MQQTTFPFCQQSGYDFKIRKMIILDLWKFSQQNLNRINPESLQNHSVHLSNT